MGALSVESPQRHHREITACQRAAWITPSRLALRAGKDIGSPSCQRRNDSGKVGPEPSERRERCQPFGERVRGKRDSAGGRSILPVVGALGGAAGREESEEEKRGERRHSGRAEGEREGKAVRE